tara:strand:- start:157 stop:735 length:579 start_codon:yes stop_codon:yes gene_type:complete
MDPLVYPGTEVLRNLFGIRDHDRLQALETFHSANRLVDLPRATLTFAGYRKLHRHLFQDVYPWAGSIRTTPLAKGTPDGGVVVFLPPRLIEPNLRRLFAEIGEGRALRHLAPAPFADLAAAVLDRVNHIHAFREGNGRVQRALLWRMGLEAGHRIDIRRISREGWMTAAVASDRHGDQQPMRVLIRDAIAPA